MFVITIYSETMEEINYTLKNFLKVYMKRNSTLKFILFQGLNKKCFSKI